MSEDEQVNKSRATQVAKYGGEEGYREEMRRRRKFNKNPGFKGMSKDRVVAAARAGGLNSRKNKHGKEDGTQTTSR